MAYKWRDRLLGCLIGNPESALITKYDYKNYSRKGIALKIVYGQFDKD